jgi:hypothetical protein
MKSKDFIQERYKSYARHYKFKDLPQMRGTTKANVALVVKAEGPGTFF